MSLSPRLRKVFIVILLTAILGVGVAVAKGGFSLNSPAAFPVDI